MSGENILNLIPKIPGADRDKLKYTSKFSSTVKDEFSKNKYLHRTMGEAEINVPDPKNYLRRTIEDNSMQQTNGSGNEKLNSENDKEDHEISGDSEHIHTTNTEIAAHGGRNKRKPPVPRANEAAPVMGIKTNKNFIAQNAVDSIMAVSKKPEKVMVDTRKGDRFPVEPSGLDPVYVKKRDYGKTPEYLQQRKRELQEMQAEYDSYIQEMRERGKMYRLSEEEIQEILYGLKTNWDNLYQQYQSLSVITDSLPKKNRKEKLENEMKELEKDIDMLERYQTIYIAN